MVLSAGQDRQGVCLFQGTVRQIARTGKMGDPQSDDLSPALPQRRDFSREGGLYATLRTRPWFFYYVLRQSPNSMLRECDVPARSKARGRNTDHAAQWILQKGGLLIRGLFYSERSL